MAFVDGAAEVVKGETLVSKVAEILEQRDLLAYLPPDVKLRATGKDTYRGHCPITQGDGFAFAVRRHTRGHFVFKCFSCNASGTVIDLVAALEHVSTVAAIRMLATGTTRMSDEAVMQRAQDHSAATEGKYVLACDPCGRTEEVATELDAAIILDGGSNWDVAPDGIGAVCYRCLSNSNQRRKLGRKPTFDDVVVMPIELT